MITAISCSTSNDPDSQLSPVIEIDASVVCLASLAGLIDSLPPQDYRQAVPICFNGSVGAHTRHILDHYSSLVQGLSDRHVDYDDRARLAVIESCPKTAALKLADLTGFLTQLGRRQLDPCLTVTARVDLLESVRPVRSSLRRELRYLHAHTVHHLAIVRIICGLLGHELSGDLGFAPSTLRQRSHS
jgi:uncharacterized damage-inducible protein DinB